MNATTIKTEIPGEFSIKLNTQPQNIRFSDAPAPNILDFQIIHFPRKLILEYLHAHHPHESAENIRGYLHIVSKPQGIDAAFQIFYTSVKSVSKTVRQHTDRSEKFFVFHYSDVTPEEKREVFRIVSPFLNRLDKTAARWFINAIYPKSLEDCAALLTDVQKADAVKLLFDTFIA